MVATRVGIDAARRPDAGRVGPTIEEGSMRNVKRLLVGTAITVMLALSGVGVQRATAAVPCVLPAGNAAQQWDEIAQKTVLNVVTFQNESFIYMAYANGAAYRAVFSSPL